jgi:hypothetical protein
VTEFMPDVITHDPSELLVEHELPLVVIAGHMYPA